MHVIWMWMRFGSRFKLISNQFWSDLWSQNCSKNSPNNTFWGSIFKPLFMRSWSSSSASWEPSWASYAHLGSLQDVKSMVFHCKMTLFENDTFWCFEALHGPLGPILAPSWPDLVPKRSRKWPQKLPQSGPKMIQKTAPQKMSSKTSLGSNLAPFWAKKSTAHFS